MCGISGIINKSNKLIYDKDIRKINDLIVHRGPDDEGYFFEKNFAFGHRRLSILDLTNDGHQPMEYICRNREYIITYNGEIYNYIEIKKELLKYGYKFHSNTDTEVILASYDKWGEKCVDRFNGMWGFAIYDKKKDIIFCSRDRFGIKPFYYTEIDNKFIFGSEIKQLLEFYSSKYVNKRVLLDYLIFSLEEHSNETFFENIYKLAQSHNLIYDLKEHKYKIKKYYEINIDSKKESEKDTIEKYKNNFLNSINIRLRSDVKVGTCLSGGLDSSAISSIASKLYFKAVGKRFVAIHAKSTEKSTDESNYAKLVANNSNLDLKIIEPSYTDFINYIDEVIYTQEEPFGGPSIFMQYFVMKEAKNEGCKVMLDGQGGDETLLGYNRYYVLYLKEKRLFDKLHEIKNIKEKSSQKIYNILYYYFGMSFYKMRIFLHKKEYGFLKDIFLKNHQGDIIKLIIKSSKDDKSLQKLENLKTNLPMLLKYEDKNSMRNSIETRLPFIDFNCVETAINANINIKMKNGWTKYILRKILDDILPKSITWRKAKLGFEAPSNSWLEKLDREIKEEISKSLILSTLIDNKKYNYDKLSNRQKWKLFNIAKWEEAYDVEIN